MAAFISETFSDGVWSSTYTHTSSVQELVRNITQKEFPILISLAANAIHNMKQSATTLQYKEAIEKEVESYTKALRSQNIQIQEKLDIAKQSAITDRESIVESLESKHSKQISSLTTKIEELKSSLAISESETRQIKSQFALITTKSEETYKLSLAEVIKQKDSQYMNEISRIEAMNKERFSQYDSQHREAMAMLKQTYSEQENKLKHQLEKTLVSSEIGKHGELEFEELVNIYTRWGTLINTSKIPHSADLTGSIKGCSTMFEIKRYSSDVPTKEVDKFLRDMDEHPEVPLGVFISQKSNIIGKKSGNFIQISWTSRSQLLVFINTFNSHNPQDIFPFIEICSEIALSMFKISNNSQSDSELSIDLQTRIGQAKTIVDCELKRITEFINTINLQKKSLIETITKHHTENSVYMNQSKLSLKTMLDILTGKSEEESTVDIPISGEPVKKPRSKKTKDIVTNIQLSTECKNSP